MIQVPLSLLLALAPGLASQEPGEARLADAFSDHMVLQRGKPVSV